MGGVVLVHGSPGRDVAVREPHARQDPVQQGERGRAVGHVQIGRAPGGLHPVDDPGDPQPGTGAGGPDAPAQLLPPPSDGPSALAPGFPFGRVPPVKRSRSLPPRSPAPSARSVTSFISGSLLVLTSSA
ncbi:hypothetical protein CCOS2040_08225 [Streptomyces albidoflavus]|nr:hypothetical protein CCOS2040_08225 [Streptomyces albidoflavus]